MIPRVKAKPETVEDFYAFKVGAMWRYFKSQHFSFWMICGYIISEFVRPQVIFPVLDAIPWAQLFLLGSMVGAIMDRTVVWVDAPQNKWMFIFLFLIIISSFVAYYPDVSRRHFMDFFGWLIIYFLIINIVNTKERFYIFVMLYVLASAKIALGTSRIWAMRGFSFTSWGLSGPNGFFQNSGELAVLMIMLFPLAFYMYSAMKDEIPRREKWLLMLFWICPIMTTMGASSRGSQIALALQLLLMFRKNIFKIKPLILTVALGTLLFLVLPEEQKARFSETGEDKSSQQRILYWTHGWEMMKDNPIFGVGYYNFIPYYESHHSQDMLYESAQLPHNIFIQVGTDTGFTGLAVFIILIALTFLSVRKIYASKNATKLDRAFALGLGYGFFGFVIAGQFVTITYYPFMWIHMAFLVVMVSVLNKKNQI